MKVAIWGSYNYGNYGDDLMAIQFAKELEKLGTEPYIYRLDKQLAQQYAINTVDSLTELLPDAEFCIIGGGGVLGGGETVLEKDFRELHALTTQSNCPVFPISIGGDGGGVDTVLSPPRMEFWQGDTCKTSTVRLEEDVDLVRKLGKEAIYYPDVLWTVGDFWQISPVSTSSDRLHVGINIPNSLRGRLLAHQLNAIAQIRKDIVFHFIRTYLPNSSINHELLPKINSPYIQHHVYTDPTTTLKFIASLDLIISYKLHVGLTALALNVPFYSVGGQGKTRALLKSINANFAILPASAKNIKLATLLMRADDIRNAKARFDFATIEQHKKLSWGHIDRLKELVNHHRKA